MGKHKPWSRVSRPGRRGARTRPSTQPPLLTRGLPRATRGPSAPFSAELLGVLGRPRLVAPVAGTSISSSWPAAASKVSVALRAVCDSAHPNPVAPPRRLAGRPAGGCVPHAPVSSSADSTGREGNSVAGSTDVRRWITASSSRADRTCRVRAQRRQQQSSGSHAGKEGSPAGYVGRASLSDKTSSPSLRLAKPGTAPANRRRLGSSRWCSTLALCPRLRQQRPAGVLGARTRPSRL